MALEDTIASLLRPASVAVVGVSNDLTKFGGKVAFNINRSNIAQRFFIHPRGEEVMGQPTYKSLADLPVVPECVVLAVAADVTLEELRRAGALGVRAAVVFASGFGEAGPQGLARDQELRRIAALYGMAVLGPNGVGAANFRDGVLLSSAEGLEMGEAGNVALISQSGSLGIAVSSRQARRFSHFISSGNESVLDAARIVRYMAPMDDGVKTFALLVESIRDPAALASATELARKHGKRVVMLKLTGEAASDRIAALHTGALSGQRAPLEAFCRQHGIVLARTLREFNGVLTLLSSSRYTGGGRLGMYTTSGGTAVLAAGFAAAHGLAMPQPTATCRVKVGEILGMDTARVTNPLDTTGINAFMPERFGEALERFANSGSFDLVLVPMGGAQGKDASERATVVLDVASRTSAAIVPVWQQARVMEEEAFRKLYDARAPFFTDFESAIEAMVLLAGDVAATDAQAPEPVAHEHANTPASVSAPAFAQVLAELESAGVPVARIKRVTASDDGAAVLADLGGPFALKVSHPELLHKSDALLVVYPVDSAAKFAAEAGRLTSSAQTMGLAGAEVIAQAGVHGGLELLCGFDRDVEMGPYVVLAAGGIYTELMKDSVVALLQPQAGLRERLQEAITRLRIAPMLSGARGRKPLDVNAALDAITAAAAHFVATPAWRAMEINPLTVKEQGAVVVDARVLL